MAKITESQRDSMFAAWQEKQSVRYVARKCAISPLTSARYRKIDNWDQRMATIKAKAVAKADDNVAKRRAKQIALITLVQKKASDYLQGVTDFDSPAAAGNLILNSLKAEREVCGEPGEISEQKLVIEYVDGSDIASTTK